MNSARILIISAALAMLSGSAWADWPQLGGNADTTGIAAAPGPVANLTTKWTANIYDGSGSALGLSFQAGEQPIVAGGTVYAYALGTPDAFWNSPAYLVALNATNGTVKWQSDRLQDEGGMMSHNTAGVDPLTGDVFIASWNTMYRLSAATGHVVWSYQSPGSYGANAVINAGPTISGTNVYWNTAGGAGHTIGLSIAQPGATATPFMNTAMPAAINGQSYGKSLVYQSGGQTVLATSYSNDYYDYQARGANTGGIVVVNATNGQEKWRMSYADLAPGATPDQLSQYAFQGNISYANGVIYAASFDGIKGHTFDGTLWAINADTGATLWKSADPNPGDGIYDNAVGGHCAPVVAGGLVFLGGGTTYYGGMGQKVQAFNAVTGARVWEDNGIGGWANQLVYANGRLYAGSEDSGISVINPLTGAILATYAGGGSSPVISDGVLYSINSVGDMAAVVPEPCTLLLCLAGFAGLVRKRRAAR